MFILQRLGSYSETPPPPSFESSRKKRCRSNPKVSISADDGGFFATMYPKAKPDKKRIIIKTKINFLYGTMFRSFVTRLQFSCIQRKIQRAVQKTKYPRKDKTCVLLPTHLRLGSAFCFPDSVRPETPSSSESKKRQYSTVVDFPDTGVRYNFNLQHTESIFSPGS